MPDIPPWPQVEALDRAWTDSFAAQQGWKDFEITDPVEDLALFFLLLPGPKVLDVGCGWGRYVWRFLDEEVDYHGLDHSAEMLKVARERNPDIPFTEGTFRKLPFADASFDAVWSCCSLYGVPKAHLVEALQEIARVVTPDGMIYIVLPAPPWSVEDLQQDEDGQPEKLVVSYSLEEFETYAKQAGLVILESGNRPEEVSFYVILEKAE